MNHPISPLDGRYRATLEPLASYFSEAALMRSRCLVELRFLEALDRTGRFPALTAAEKERVAQATGSFTDADFDRVKEIELSTRHDVKACELFLVERLQLRQPGLVHFGLTSEDTNNLAYSLLLRAYRDEQQLPLVRQLLQALVADVHAWSAVPFPTRTHGQPASPSTAGKELAVFVARLLRQYRQLRDLDFRGKLSGATGTYAAFMAAVPDYDWIAFSRDFVTSLGLQHNAVTTQIEDHDTWSEYFAVVQRVATIVLDLDLDMWEYISRGFFVQRARPGDVGSSTMPHKVNPIHFENSEGNLALGLALLATMAQRFGHSRMQRDLSDSTIERNIGVALGHVHLALTETLRGLERIDLAAAACRAQLEASPELLAEPFQVILKYAGVHDAYDRLKALTRGTEVSREQLDRLARESTADPAVQRRLLDLTVPAYVGAAERLCRQVVEEAQAEIGS